MMPRRCRYVAAVVAALHQRAISVTPRHATAWDIELRDGARLAAHVAIDEAWVRVEASDPGASTNTSATDTGDLWSLLIRNASLPPGLKLAFAVGATAAPPVRLHGELMLDDAAELSVQMLGLLDAVRTVAHGAPGPMSVSTTVEPAIVAGLAGACNDAGWPVTEREGRILVELDVPDGFAQADVAPRRDGVAIAVAVGDVGASPTLRAALALLLLRTSASIRLVRAAAQPTPRFEVVLNARQPSTITHALSALSVAYGMAAREAAVLSGDAIVADNYLRQFDHPAGSPRVQPRTAPKAVVYGRNQQQDLAAP